MSTVLERELDAVEAEIADISGVLNVAHGRLVELVARVIEAELWKGWGIRSVEHWLTIRAGLSRTQANRIVATARRHAELPITMERLRAGELTLDQAAAVAALAPAHIDAQAASLAAVSTVTQLRSTLHRHQFVDEDTADAAADDSGGRSPDDTGSTLRGTSDGDGPQARGAMAPGFVSVHTDGPRFGLHADLPADDGALVEQALREAKDALFQAGLPSVTWADALLEICRRSLASEMAPSRTARYRTWIHLDVTGGWVNQGGALPQGLLDKVTCDGVVQPLWIKDGRPVSVGRSTRVIPERTRRLVLDRDQCCVFPGCGSRHHLEVHHLVHWRRGGPTDMANLAALCPAHHDAHHRGDFNVTGNAEIAGSLQFIDRLGNPIPGPVQPTPPPRGLAAAPRGSRYRPPTGEPLRREWIHFPSAPPKRVTITHMRT
ncbi:MAG: HNH endonuclease [Nocardioidaceae bacterium]